MPAPRKLERGEGSLERRGTDRRGRTRWRGVVRIDGVKRYTRTSTDRTEVYEWLGKLVNPEPEPEPEPGDGITLGEWLAEWLAELAPAGDGVENTDENRRWAIDKLAGLHPRTLAELDTETIESYLRKIPGRGGRPLSKNSLTRIRAVLGQALDAAIFRRKMSGQYGNPARGAVLPRRAAEPEKRRTLTTKQVGRLLEVAKTDPVGIAVVLMVWLGLRPGEATGLRWDAIDLDRGELSVTQFRRVSKDPKTGRERITYASPKSGSDRRMALPPEVLSALRRHKREQIKRRMAAAPGVWTETGLVVTTSVGTALYPANLRRTIRSLAKAAGIKWTPELRPYELRHTAASLLIYEAKAVDGSALYSLSDVADLLGNDVKTLAKHYLHRSRRVVDVRAGQRKAIGGRAS